MTMLMTVMVVMVEVAEDFSAAGRLGAGRVLCHLTCTTQSTRQLSTFFVILPVPNNHFSSLQLKSRIDQTD